MESVARASRVLNPERMLYISIDALAQRCAMRRSPLDEEVAILRAEARGRRDLLAIVAGLTLGCGFADHGALSAFEIRKLKLLVAAGADIHAIGSWAEVGRRRVSNAPFSRSDKAERQVPDVGSVLGDDPIPEPEVLVEDGWTYLTAHPLCVHRLGGAATALGWTLLREMRRGFGWFEAYGSNRIYQHSERDEWVTVGLRGPRASDVLSDNAARIRASELLPEHVIVTQSWSDQLPMS
jgi:hypothetical protein